MRERWVLAGVVVLLLGFGTFVGHATYREWTARDWLVRGDDLYRAGHYHSALAAYDQGQTLKPSPEARERIKLAETTIMDQAPGGPGGDPARARLSATKIRAALAAERFAEVQQSMQDWLTQKTTSPSGYLHAASVLSRTVIDGDTWANKAVLLTTLDAWVQQDPASSLARTFRGAYHYGAAWKARGTGWASTVSEQGWALMRERLALAARDLDAASALDPANPLPSWLLLSAARPMGADPQTMDRHFRRALEYDANFFQPYVERLQDLMPKWGGSEEAMFAFARDAVKRAPRGSAIPFLLVEAHREKGCNIVKDCPAYYRDPAVWAEIQQVFLRLMEDFPGSALWPSRYAQAAQVAGRLEVARLYHDLAVQRDPDEFEVRYERGWFFEEYLSDLRGASLEYLEARRIEPVSLKALNRYGSILYRTRQWPQAVAAYSTLIEVAPEDPKAFFMRASAYYTQHQFREAIEDYSRAIALRPDYQQAYQWRAKSYQNLGMLEKQQEDVRTFKALPPQSE